MSISRPISPILKTLEAIQPTDSKETVYAALDEAKARSPELKETDHLSAVKQTPLMVAVMKQHKYAVAWCLAHTNAKDIQAADEKGMTALAQAVAYEDLSIPEIKEEKRPGGAEVKTPDSARAKTLELADPRKEIIELILEEYKKNKLKASDAEIKAAVEHENIGFLHRIFVIDMLQLKKEWGEAYKLYASKIKFPFVEDNTTYSVTTIEHIRQITSALQVAVENNKFRAMQFLTFDALKSLNIPNVVNIGITNQKLMQEMIQKALKKPEQFEFVKRLFVEAGVMKLSLKGFISIILEQYKDNIERACEVIKLISVEKNGVTKADLSKAIPYHSERLLQLILVHHDGWMNLNFNELFTAGWSSLEQMAYSLIAIINPEKLALEGHETNGIMNIFTALIQLKDIKDASVFAAFEIIADKLQYQITVNDFLLVCERGKEFATLFFKKFKKLNPKDWDARGPEAIKTIMRHRDKIEDDSILEQIILYLLEKKHFSIFKDLLETNDKRIILISIKCCSQTYRWGEAQEALTKAACDCYMQGHTNVIPVFQAHRYEMNLKDVLNNYSLDLIRILDKNNIISVYHMNDRAHFERLIKSDDDISVSKAEWLLQTFRYKLHNVSTFWPDYSPTLNEAVLNGRLNVVMMLVKNNVPVDRSIVQTAGKELEKDKSNENKKILFKYLYLVYLLRKDKPKNEHLKAMGDMLSFPVKEEALKAKLVKALEKLFRGSPKEETLKNLVRETEYNRLLKFGEVEERPTLADFKESKESRTHLPLDNKESKSAVELPVREPTAPPLPDPKETTYSDLASQQQETKAVDNAPTASTSVQSGTDTPGTIIAPPGGPTNCVAQEISVAVPSAPPEQLEDAARLSLSLNTSVVSEGSALASPAVVSETGGTKKVDVSVALDSSPTVGAALSLDATAISEETRPVASLENQLSTAPVLPAIVSSEQKSVASFSESGAASPLVSNSIHRSSTPVQRVPEDEKRQERLRELSDEARRLSDQLVQCMQEMARIGAQQAEATMQLQRVLAEQRALQELSKPAGLSPRW